MKLLVHQLIRFARDVSLLRFKRTILAVLSSTHNLSLGLSDLQLVPAPIGTGPILSIHVKSMASLQSIHRTASREVTEVARETWLGCSIWRQ
jgi:hypothetical protein